MRGGQLAEIIVVSSGFCRHYQKILDGLGCDAAMVRAMTANRNWGLITTGEMFEALATTLIFFEEPTSKLFGRRGKDGGQDARSGSRVFQAKHHEQASAAKAIADAKKEAAKLAKYRKPGHKRYEQWNGVTQWRLVTNASFNTTDDKRWSDEVVPLFEELNLEADYWEQATLDGLLAKWPEVDRAFFQGENRAFHTLPEVCERLPLEEPFMVRDTLGSFFGRDKERTAIREFLASDKLFLVIHGAGGVGKTRLMLKAGEDIAEQAEWQVLWALVESMRSTPAWFAAIHVERPILLLVDEPPDDNLLRQLAEQMGRGRTSKWKVVVTVRSPKDPVLRFLSEPRIKRRVDWLPVGGLTSQDAEDMCCDLLVTSRELGESDEVWRADVSRTLAARFSRHPVWLTLAVRLLEEEGDLTRVPDDSRELAALYLEEIERQHNTEPEHVRMLLRWVALIGTLNRNDEQSVQLIADAVGFTNTEGVKKLLQRLVERRALVQRGAYNRLLELKPDVLRDHVLDGWLCVDVGYGPEPIQPSEHAKKLVRSVQAAVIEGQLSALGRSVLVSLARTESLLEQSERPVRLLDTFFSTLEAELDAIPARGRLALAGVLEDIAVFRPADTARLCRALRSSTVATETVDQLFGERELGQSDVILSLAWPLFHAAMGARPDNEHNEQQLVLEELLALAEAEAQIAPSLPYGLPNNGKRAAALVERTLEGGPQFWSHFDEQARLLSLRFLAEVADHAPSAARMTAMKALIEPLLRLERHQSWSEGFKIVWQRFIILRDSQEWSIRADLIECIKKRLSDASVPLASRVFFWKLLVESHGNANQAHSAQTDLALVLRDELLDDLKWARTVLRERTQELEELEAARGIWDWHRRFEKDEELKTAADELEQLYKNNELAREFQALFSYDIPPDELAENRESKGEELANANSPDVIRAFLDRATLFIGGEDELYRLSGGIAWVIGKHGPTHKTVREFVKQSIAQPERSMRTDFAMSVAASWIAKLRHPPMVHEQVSELLADCGSETQKLDLLQRLYAGMRTPTIQELTPQESALLRSYFDLFKQHDRLPVFISAVAATLAFEWDACKELLERALEHTSEEQLVLAMRGLVDSVHSAIYQTDSSDVPEDLGRWLGEQMLRLPALSDLGSNTEWRVKQILKTTGRIPLAWLPTALTKRIQMARQAAEQKNPRVMTTAQLSDYVTRVTQADAMNRESKQAIKKLVDLASDRGTVGYHMPKILAKVDPHGLLVPNVVAQRVAETNDIERMRSLARIGGPYANGSDAWRKIAKPILERASILTEQDRASLFDALERNGVRTYGGRPGEVPAVFISACEQARDALAQETDSALLPFWKWLLATTEARLQDEEQRAKEVRGE